MSQEILAIVLDKPSRAEEVLLALVHLQQENKVHLHDAVIVAKDSDGRPRIVETVDVTPAKGAMSGSWWGLLVGIVLGGPIPGAIGGAAAGAIDGKLVDRGLDDAWVKGMAEWIDPDTSALLLLVEDGVGPDVIEELRRFEGTAEVAFTTLPEGARAVIDEALAGG